MHYLLHIDTSTDAGTVAVSADGRLLCRKDSAEGRNHAAAINIMIDAVLAEAQINLRQLNAIVVCSGPGSYTGLRIGMATAKALCYVLDIPLVLQNRLELLANTALQQYKEFDAAVVVLQARDKEYFVAGYTREMSVLIEPKHIYESQIAETVQIDSNQIYVIENITNIDKTLFNKEIKIILERNIDYNSWSSYAHYAFICNRFVNLPYAEPFYLKQPYTHK